MSGVEHVSCWVRSAPDDIDTEPGDHGPHVSYLLINIEAVHMKKEPQLSCFRNRTDCTYIVTYKLMSIEQW
jgi:hypothetical protein